MRPGAFLLLGVFVAGPLFPLWAAAPEPFPFADAGPAVTPGFVHWNGMTGRRLFVEMMGSGGAFLDYDRDGDLDLFLVQGSELEKGKVPLFPPPAQPGGRLFRNDLIESGRLGFTDVTAASGIGTRLYGMGATVGDIDNDGLPDLFLTGYGENELWRNLGDGRFADHTAPSGLRWSGLRQPWTLPAVFFDADNDGDEDLYVGEYVEYSVEEDKVCYSAGGAADYCGPIAYRSAKDRLYRNRGDGTFEDVTASAKIAAQGNAALGAISLDADGDGRLDLYVANDGEPNFLWRSRGDGTYENIALLAGCAVNAAGLAEASMGVDAGDVDGDGDEDLFITHLSQETNTFYRNQGDGFFEDHTAASGLGPPSFAQTSFGTSFIDFDLDGELDLVTVSGTIRTLEDQVLAKEIHPLQQRPQLFRNLGGGRFAEVPPASSPLLSEKFVGRGLAAGDVDNDGDLDLALFANAGRLRLWLGQASKAGPAANWVGFELASPAGGRIQALHSRITLFFADGKKATQRVKRDGSYLSSHDPRRIFGLGAGRRIAKVQVAWWLGGVEEFPAPEPGRYHRLEPGQGRAVTATDSRP